MSQNRSRFQTERRKHPRITVQIWAIEQNDDSRSFHLLTNLSIGGFFIEKKFPFQIGSTVNLELDLDGELLPLQGKVVDNYKNPVTGLSGAGVRFVDMDERVKTKVKGYLNKLEKTDQLNA